MEKMDLSIQNLKSAEVVGVQKMLEKNYECHVFKLRDYEETDVKGNNNLLINSLKTDTNNDLDKGPSSLFQDKISENEKPKLVGEPSILDCKTLKRAIDLRIHNRTSEGNKRTIFEDAEYFAKNYSYKLLPITFDSVDERIIHIEHSYCYLLLNSASEDEEDCSRTMDYTWIKEKHYKKRKTKFKQEDSEEKCDEADVADEKVCKASLKNPTKDNYSFNTEPKNLNTLMSEQEFVCPAQPLDLSTPLVQEKKTDHCLREHQISILNKNIDGNGNSEGKSELEKENLKSKVRCIEVTITRPDEKENYQPCDLFLNDIAKLVPRLVEKDCSEIDILDRTCDNYVDVRKNRLYYIISKSTWRLFQSANERVILTNDQSLGQPALRVEGNERPTFLVFDQFSLAKCLADYCKEIGGCFEYTCVEESENLPLEKEEKNGKEESVEEKELNETEVQVEEEQMKGSTKSEVQIKFENVKNRESKNKVVNIERNLIESPCCNYENDNESENESVKNIPFSETEKVFVKTVEVNLNKGKMVERKLEGEIERTELKEKLKEATSVELTTCSTENTSTVEERISSESKLNLAQMCESDTTRDVEKHNEREEKNDNHCLNTTEENFAVPNLQECNTKNKGIDMKTIKNVARRKRKQDFKETNTDVKMKKSNVVSRVTTRSKATIAESKNYTTESFKLETSQYKDEPNVKVRRDLKRKKPVLEKKIEIKKEIPKRRKRATTLEILTQKTSSDRKIRSGKVKVERKNERTKKETEITKQEQPGNAKRNEKRNTARQEGVVKTRKAVEAANSRGLRSRTETSRKNVNFETVKIQKRDRKKAFTETRQKRKKKVIGFSSRSNR